MPLTLSTVRAVEARLALALPEHAVAVAAAALGAVTGQLAGHLGHEGHLLRLVVVVVDAQKPMAGLQVVADGSR